MSLSDKEFVLWGARFTRREFWGTPWELAFGTVVVLGSPLFMLYALDTFPTLDANAPLLLVVSVSAFAGSWLLSIVFRNALFPWGYKAPLAMWGCTFAVALIGMMLAIGGALTANGAFDTSQSVEHRTEVTRRRPQGDVQLGDKSFPTVLVTLDLTRYEFYDIQRGDSISIFVKPGALGVPWIERYRIQ